MLKLATGDIGLMAFGIIVVLVMMALDLGRGTDSDPIDELRARQRFLDQIARTWSPALVIATIIGAAGVAYMVLGLYARSK